MKRLSGWVAVTSAAALLAVPASAQFGNPQPGTGTLGAVDLSGGGGAPLYDFHWHQMASEPSFVWAGPAMWNFFNGGNPNVGGPGDAIRVCYGIDVTQGGRNWSGPGSTSPGPFSAGLPVASGGQTENTWIRWAQGFAASDAGVDFGLISVQAGTTSSRGGDNCFTPFTKGFGVPTARGPMMSSLGTAP